MNEQNNKGGHKASALKALNMKIAAIQAIMEERVTGRAREKTFAFLDKPHEQLKQEIKQGKYKQWGR